MVTMVLRRVRRVVSASGCCELSGVVWLRVLTTTLTIFQYCIALLKCQSEYAYATGSVARLVVIDTQLKHPTLKSKLNCSSYHAIWSITPSFTVNWLCHHDEKKLGSPCPDVSLVLPALHPKRSQEAQNVSMAFKSLSLFYTNQSPCNVHSPVNN